MIGSYQPLKNCFLLLILVELSHLLIVCSKISSLTLTGVLLVMRVTLALLGMSISVMATRTTTRRLIAIMCDVWEADNRFIWLFLPNLYLGEIFLIHKANRHKKVETKEKVLIEVPYRWNLKTGVTNDKKYIKFISTNYSNI